MAASLSDLEKAISREVLKNHKTQIWDVVQKQLVHTTLADPDQEGQWTDNEVKTTVGSKRPWAFSKRKVGRAAATLCQPGVKKAWENPAHIAEEKRVCGDRNWVYPYKRVDKRVKGHCRKLSGPQKQSMEIALQKQAIKKKQRQLAALIRKRDNTSSVASIAKLEKQMRALRDELKPTREPT